MFGGKHVKETTISLSTPLHCEFHDPEVPLENVSSSFSSNSSTTAITSKFSSLKSQAAITPGEILSKDRSRENIFPSEHSIAIPIAGRKSPAPGSGWIPSTNTQGLTMYANFGSTLELPYSAGIGGLAGSFGAFGTSVIPASAPMPSPINRAFVSFPPSLTNDEIGRPSPPNASRSVGAGFSKMAHSGSPKHFEESMFSFRAGSILMVEEQLQKQRRRKENHNAVERRRRDTINIMISRLALLVTGGPGGQLDPVVAGKLNKGEVLEASVKRILALNQTLAEMEDIVRELDPNHPILEKHQELLSALVTQLPDIENDSRATESPESAAMNLD